MKKFKEYIKESFNNYNYEIPESKKELLFDFYVSTNFFRVHDPKHYPELYDENLSYITYEMQNKLYDYLQDHLVTCVVGAVICEMAHVNDEVDETFDDKEITGSDDAKKMLDGYFRFIAASGHQTTYSDKIYNGLQYLKKYNVTNEEFLKICYQYFTIPKWTADYGGEAWGKICLGGLRLLRAKTLNEKMMGIDHVYDLEHNNGTIMNKIKDYNQYDMKPMLDIKRYAKSAFDLVALCSKGFQSFATYVLTKTKEPKSKYGLIGSIFNFNTKLKNGVYTGDIDLGRVALIILDPSNPIIPKEFKGLTIAGDFHCNHIPLMNLENMPKKVNRLYITGALIKNLEGIPEANEINLEKLHNLESLKGCPETLDRLVLRNTPNLGSFEYGPKICKSILIDNANISNLEHFPPVESLVISNCPLKQLNGFQDTNANGYIAIHMCGLKNLKGLEHVKNLEWLNVSSNEIVSLEGCPQNIVRFYCDHNKLKNFKGIGNITEKIVAYDNPLESFEGLENNKPIDLFFDNNIQFNYTPGMPDWLFAKLLSSNTLKNVPDEEMEKRVGTILTPDSWDKWDNFEDMAINPQIKKFTPPKNIQLGSKFNITFESFIKYLKG